MSAVIVNGSTPFGSMSNEMIDNINAVNAAILRLQAASAMAASGYGGVAGTEYETNSNFGVTPSATPGAQGAAYAYALGLLAQNWATFWTAAQGAISTLDNG